MNYHLLLAILMIFWYSDDDFSVLVVSLFQ